MSAPVAPQDPNSLSQDQLVSLINQSRQYWKCSWISNMNSLISDFFDNDKYSQYRQGPWLVLPYNKITDVKVGDSAPTTITFDPTVTNTNSNGDSDYTDHPLEFYPNLSLPDGYKYDQTSFKTDSSSRLEGYVYPCDQGMYWELPLRVSTYNYITYNIKTSTTGTMSSRSYLSNPPKIPFKYIKVNPNKLYDIPNIYSTNDPNPVAGFSNSTYLIRMSFNNKQEEYDFINKCRQFWKLNWRYNLEKSGIVLPSQDYKLDVFNVYPYTEIKKEQPGLDNSKLFYDFDPSVINTDVNGLSTYTQKPSTFSPYMKITESVDLYKDYKNQQRKDSNDNIQGGDKDNVPSELSAVSVVNSSINYPIFSPSVDGGYNLNIPQSYNLSLSSTSVYLSDLKKGLKLNISSNNGKPVGQYRITTSDNSLNFGFSSGSEDVTSSSSVNTTVTVNQQSTLTNDLPITLTVNNSEDSRILGTITFTVSSKVNPFDDKSTPSPINPDDDPNAPAKYSPFVDYEATEDSWKTDVRYKLAGSNSLSKHLMNLIQAYMSVISFYNSLKTNKGKFDESLLDDPYFLPESHPIFNNYTLKIQSGMATPPYFLNNAATRKDTVNIEVQAVVASVKALLEGNSLPDISGHIKLVSDLDSTTDSNSSVKAEA